MEVNRKRPAAVPLNDITNLTTNTTNNAPSKVLGSLGGLITRSFKIGGGPAVVPPHMIQQENPVPNKQQRTASQMVTRSKSNQQQQQQQLLQPIQSQQQQQQYTQQQIMQQQQQSNSRQQQHLSNNNDENSQNSARLYPPADSQQRQAVVEQSSQSHLEQVKTANNNNNNNNNRLSLQCKDEDFMDVDDSVSCDDSMIEDANKCTEYAEEIYAFLVERQKIYQPKMYLSEQKDLNASMRGILVDWLVEVSEEYNLATETLYLTVNYIDRYLSLCPVVRSKLQLIGVVCMLIASKFEEVYAPAVDEFVYISDNTYSKEEIFEMEGYVLNILEFLLTAPTIRTFLRRYLRVVGSESGEVAMLASYLCELSILDYQYIQYSPSVVAASAVCLALHCKGLPHWPAQLSHLTQFTPSTPEIRSCVERLHKSHIDAERNSLKSVREKYSQNAMLNVSMIPPARVLPWNKEL